MGLEFRELFSTHVNVRRLPVVHHLKKERKKERTRTSNVSIIQALEHKKYVDGMPGD